MRVSKASWAGGKWKVGAGKSVGALREWMRRRVELGISRRQQEKDRERESERGGEGEEELFMLESKALAHDEVRSPWLSC